jgi:hypothetical protein
MLTNEQIQFGIKSLENSIISKKEEINSWKECILNDLQSTNFDEVTVNMIDSRLKKIQKLMSEIDVMEGKIKVINEIINN